LDTSEAAAASSSKKRPKRTKVCKIPLKSVFAPSLAAAEHYYAILTELAGAIFIAV
jgi:hypothetical protein